MTGLQKHMTKEELLSQGWVNPDGSIKNELKTVEQGAATSVYAAGINILNN